MIPQALTSSRLQNAIIGVGSVVVVLFLFGQNLRAKWWTTDDLEVMTFVGKEEHLATSKIVPTLLSKTELDPLSRQPRFRPSYYALRVAEAWAWGKNPMLWYAFHLAFFASFMMAVWYTANPLVGFLPAALLAIYTVTFSSWSDIFARLGASEAYATLGLTFTLFGLHAMFRAGKSERGWLLLFVGIVVAAGAKENFIVLLVPAGIALAAGLHRKTANWAAYLSMSLSLLWCAWIASVVMVRLRNWGGDVYFNSVEPGNRAATLLQGLTHTGILPLYGLGILFLCLWICLRKWNGRAANTALFATIGTVLLIGLYLSQVVYYNGDWPRSLPVDWRYNVPGLLCWPLALFLILWTARKLSSSLPIVPGSRLAIRRGVFVIRLPAVRVVQASMVLIGLAAVISHVGDASVERIASQSNVRRTTRFTGVIERLARVAARHPDYPILVQTNYAWDYEAVVSYYVFSRAYGVPNEMYLIWIPDEHPSSPWLDHLRADLARYSEQGWGDTYLPRPQLNIKGQKCILVVVAGEPEKTCQVEIDGQWRDF